MKRITSTCLIEELRLLFARFGLPAIIVSDNGTSFTCEQFKQFLPANGIKHVTTAPYTPSSNGQAERCVQTAKNALRKMKNDGGNLNQKLATFLLNYRKTPHATTNESPNYLLMKRIIRSRLDLLLPNMRNTIKTKQEQLAKYSSNRNFEIGDKVSVRMFGGQKWKIGKIISKESDYLYSTLVGNDVHRRHVNQLRHVGSDLSLDEPELPIPLTTSNDDDSFEENEPEKPANSEAIEYDPEICTESASKKCKQRKKKKKK